MSEEIWKRFHGIEVSNFGNLRTPKRQDGSYRGFDHWGGYKLVNVTIDDKHKTFQVHRLVAHLFLDLNLNDPKKQVNHINGIRNDNSLENLEVVDNRENSQKRKCHSEGRLFGTVLMKNIKKNPWVAQITINGKPKYLGMYRSERLAHMISVANYIDHYGTPPHCTCDYCS